MGIWWGAHWRKQLGNRRHTRSHDEEAIRYIDFIAESGLDGFLVEGWNIGWDGDWIANADLFSFTEAQPFFDLETVAAHAEEKGVDLVLHNETSGGIKNYEAQMEAAYALYQRLGVNHLKTGYVGFTNGYRRDDVHEERPVYEWNHGQWMVNHYQKSIEMAAKYQIGINMHEPIKPTGLRRTYPNFMTREGVRGQEYNAWSEGNQPAHTTILPFTRMVAGPLDFTPGVFDLTFKGEDSSERIRTTIAKQLALMVVLYSPCKWRPIYLKLRSQTRPVPIHKGCSSRLGNVDGAVGGGGSTSSSPDKSVVRMTGSSAVLPMSWQEAPDCPRFFRLAITARRFIATVPKQTGSPTPTTPRSMYRPLMPELSYRSTWPLGVALPSACISYPLNRMSNALGRSASISNQTKLVAAGLMLWATASSADVTRVDPPHWWVGMASDELQLMLYGEDIATFDVATRSDSIRIINASKGDSDNYLFVDLSIDENADSAH